MLNLIPTTSYYNSQKKKKILSPSCLRHRFTAEIYFKRNFLDSQKTYKERIKHDPYLLSKVSFFENAKKSSGKKKNQRYFFYGA